jgi:hypothetical protein
MLALTRVTSRVVTWVTVTPQVRSRRAVDDVGGGGPPVKGVGMDTVRFEKGV